jgi:phosphoglycolate phosphatase
MKYISTIVFDLDGTLADSSACIVQAAHYVCERIQIPLVADEKIRSTIGKPLGPMLASLFGIEGSLLDQAIEDYSDEYRRLAKMGERLFDGSIGLLHAVREAGFKMAVATGKSQKGAEDATARMGIRDYFDSIHGILPGTPGKPDPAVLIRAMKALHAKPEDCIMVGDTTFDLDLSHAVGVRTAAVGWGVHSIEKLLSRDPHFLAMSFQELEEWLLAQKCP